MGLKKPIINPHEYLCSIYRISSDTDVSLPNNTVVKVLFPKIERDPKAMIENNGIRIKKDGIYLITANILVGAIVSGLQYRLYLNGGMVDRLGFGTLQGISGAVTKELKKDDYLEVYAYQSSGTATNIPNARLAVFRLGD